MDETLHQAKQRIGKFVVSLIEKRPTADDLATLVEIAKTLRSIMDHTEEGSLFDEAHRLLDTVGQLLHEHFPKSHCSLNYEDGVYHQTCPVDLAHRRFGFSVGFTTKSAECSICGLDPQLCDHVRGFEYDGQKCYRRIIELDLHEVSLVDRPKDPNARICTIPVPIKDLKRALGDSFQPGARVACNKCQHGCMGLVYLNVD